MNTGYVISVDAINWVSDRVFNHDACTYNLGEVSHAIMYLVTKNDRTVLDAIFIHSTEFECDIDVMADGVIEEIEKNSKDIFESESLEIVPVRIGFTEDMILFYSNLAHQTHSVFNFMPVKDLVMTFLFKHPIYAVEYLNGSHLDTFVTGGAFSYFQMLHVDEQVVARCSELEIEKEIWIKYWREQKEIVIPFDVAEALYGALCDHPVLSAHVADFTVNQFASSCMSKPELTNLLFSSFVLQSALDFSTDRTKYIGTALFESGYKIEPCGAIDTEIRIKLDRLSTDQESQLMELLGVDKNGLFESFLLQPALYLESLITNKALLPSRCLHRLISKRNSRI